MFSGETIGEIKQEKKDPIHPLSLSEHLPCPIAHFCLTACICNGRSADVKQFGDMQLPFDTNMELFMLDRLGMSADLFYSIFYMIIGGRHVARLNDVTAGFCHLKRITILARGRGAGKRPADEQLTPDSGNARSSSDQMPPGTSAVQENRVHIISL